MKFLDMWMDLSDDLDYLNIEQPNDQGKRAPQRCDCQHNNSTIASVYSLCPAWWRCPDSGVFARTKMNVHYVEVKK